MQKLAKYQLKIRDTRWPFGAIGRQGGYYLEAYSTFDMCFVGSGRTVPLKQIVVPALVEKVEAFACSMKLLTNPIILSEKGFLKRRKTDHILH